MTDYFLGVDVGGTKTHALLASDAGQVIAFAQAGPGNWETVGYEGLTRVLSEVCASLLAGTGIRLQDLAGAGFGIAGYDWESQRQAHLEALGALELKVRPALVNDTLLGIPAGAEEGWGISIVAGTGCNCRGLSRDHTRQGRMVGGAGHWSGEAAGGFDILARALRAVTFEWAKRGPATALSTAFLQHTGAPDLDDLVEGAYIGRYALDPTMILRVFEAAHQGDPQALEVMAWAGSELGGMVLGVAGQLDLHEEPFDVVMIGSIFDGHPGIIRALEATVLGEKPHARLCRFTLPPVVGAVLLGMQAAGLDFRPRRQPLLDSTTEHLRARGTILHDGSQVP